MAGTRQKKRTAPVNIALTPDERARFNAAAARDGITLAAWLRQLATRAARVVDAEDAVSKPVA